MSFDILQAWQYLSGGVMAIAGAKTKGEDSVDHSFITPTIIALGDFDESNVEEIKRLTQGEPVLFWNIGRRDLPMSIREVLNNQIIEVDWRSPCKFSKTPTLECIFSLCESVKSWYDLSEKNLAIIHCPTGYPNTGILIACLLKYIQAFDKAESAHEFYCNRRLKCDPSTLMPAPSYRTLFENVDQTVNSKGYLNVFPLHLKTITIAGLPVEEIPCIEMYDLSGKIFSSHVNWKHTSMCKWDAEFGDGYFQVGQNVLGDFIILCRFGGQLAQTREKSTLIFKYQNSTAFLPGTTLELRAGSVDINPNYADSMDIETFTLHLAFEDTFTEDDNGTKIQNHPLDINKQYTLPTYRNPGTLLSFEGGLDEISKSHTVVPTPDGNVDLNEILETNQVHKEGKKYCTVALQLSNNSVENARQLIQTLMLPRREQLMEADLAASRTGNKRHHHRRHRHKKQTNMEGGTGGEGSEEVTTAEGNTQEEEGDGEQSDRESVSGSDSGSSVSGRSSVSSVSLDEEDPESISYLERHAHTPKSPRHTRSTELAAAGSPSGNSDEDDAHFHDVGEGEEGKEEWEVVDFKCPVCASDEPEISDQLIGCSICARPYHTHCVGQRRIPFSNKTEKEIESRNKYVNKHFKEWRCANCVACSVEFNRGPGAGSSNIQSLINSAAGSNNVSRDASTGSLNEAVEGVAMSKGVGLASGNTSKNYSNISTPASASTPVPPGKEVPSSGASVVSAGGGSVGSAQKSQPASRQSYGMATGGGGVIVVDSVRNILTSPTGQPFTPLVPNTATTAGNAPGTVVPPVTSPSALHLRKVVSELDFEATDKEKKEEGGSGGVNKEENVTSLGEGVQLPPRSPRPLNSSVMSSASATSQRSPTHSHHKHHHHHHHNHPASPALTKSKHDQMAGLLGLLSSHGLTPEDLLAMSEDKQREALINLEKSAQYQALQQAQLNASGGNSPAKQHDLATVLKGLIAKTNAAGVQAQGGSLGNNAYAAVGPAHINSATSTTDLKFISVGGTWSDDPSEVDPSAANDGPFDARKHMMEMIKRKTAQQQNNLLVESGAVGMGVATSTQPSMFNSGSGTPSGMMLGGASAGGAYYMGGGGGGSGGYPQGGPGAAYPFSVPASGQTSPHPSQQGGGGAGFPMMQTVKNLLPSLNPPSLNGPPPTILTSEFAKYHKMVKVGIPRHSVAEKLVAEGLVKSESLALELLQLDPNAPIPEKFFNLPNYNMDQLIPVCEHPHFKKYFKMIKLGLPVSAVKAKMLSEGLDPDVLDLAEDELVLQPQVLQSLHSPTNGGIGPGSSNAGGGLSGVYAASGIVGNGGGVIGGPGGGGYYPGGPGGAGGGSGGYFGGPGGGGGGPGFGFEPGGGPGNGGFPGGGYPGGGGGGTGGVNYYMGSPMHGQPGGGNGGGGGMFSPPNGMFSPPGGSNNMVGKLVVASAHPNYLKYYKMLKAGVSKEEIKQLMLAEGLNAGIVDNDFVDPVPLDGSAAPGGQKVPISEHPKYAQYYKMLKIGLPKHAVQLKMEQNGVDPNMLNKPPDELIPLEETPPAGAADGTKTDEPKVAISEHPKYAKFFKMLKIGLPAEAVKKKMEQENVDPTMLDKDPTTLIPVNEKSAEDKAAEEAQDNIEKVPLAEHPKYQKYFKMLKVGLPPPAVKAKMEQEGVDPTMLDKPGDTMWPVDEEAAKKAGKKKKEVEKIAVSEHPKYQKYFKMLKVGLPPPAVKAKMTQEGVDPTMLDKPPDELIPVNEEEGGEDDAEEMVAAQDHPIYGKYFKMLKVGLPLVAVKGKCTQEGFDASVLDKAPTDMIPVNDKKKDEGKTGGGPGGGGGKLGGAGGPLAGLLAGRAAGGAPKGPKVTKKKLHWKALDADKVKNSLWAEDDDEAEEDLHMDEEEFQRLFVQSVDSSKANGPAAVAAIKAKEVKKVKVSLINMKRAQNAGIALARIRMDYPTLRNKINDMDGEGLTTDQLKSLEEFLPQPDEEDALKGYKGELKDLGQAEQYMTTMLGFAGATKRIRCMIFKQNFRSRVVECKKKLGTIENACDDVKMSMRLKKVLKTILRVGNQLNDGEKHSGFTLDSLLKLQSAKAFDRKTSVLQYVITLIMRNDADCLRFPEDLANISESSRLTLDAIASEKKVLRDEFDQNFKIVTDIEEKEPTPRTGAMVDFFCRAENLCKELERSFEEVKKKFQGVLAYFGEDGGMNSSEFFTTLHKFVQEFVTVRDAAERQRATELKRAEQDRVAIEQKEHKAQQLAKQEAQQAVREREGTAGGDDPMNKLLARRRSTTFMRQQPQAAGPGSSEDPAEEGGFHHVAPYGPEGSYHPTSTSSAAPNRSEGQQGSTRNSGRQGGQLGVGGAGEQGEEGGEPVTASPPLKKMQRRKSSYM